LLTGKLPFIGTSLDELEQKLRNLPLPTEQLVRARVPRKIISLLRSLLAVDPGLRPQSARELLGLLRRCQEKFPLLASERKRRLLRRLLVCALSIAICAAGAFGFYKAQVPVIPPDRSIAVLPFQNLNPDHADGFYTSAVQYGFAAVLAHMPSYKVIGPESTGAYVSKNLDYSAIGRKLGVRYLLEGSVRRDGDMAHVSIRLLDVNNLTHPLTSQYDVPVDAASPFQNNQLRDSDTVRDPSQLLAFLQPGQSGGLGSLALGVGASVPFTEYEAEAGTLAGGASVVSLLSPPTPDRSTPQLEASGRAYVQLAGKDQSVSWTNNTDKSFTAINVRFSIPDAVKGGGTNATLDLFVNGTFRQALHLTSKQTWLYQSSVLQDGMSKVPAPGLSPHVFFDETHVFIQGDPVAPGSTIMLKPDPTDLAAFYWIDLIDLETPPAPVSKPADFLSITDFGARADDAGFDNTDAFKKCISAAEAQQKAIWIPTGTFYLKPSQENLHADGIKIEGAGPWHSTIYSIVPLPSSAGPDILYCSSCAVRNLAFDSNANATNIFVKGVAAVNMQGSDWLLDNVWAQHVGLVDANGLAGTVKNCRVNNAWGTGIAINNAGPDTNTGAMLDIENNFCRGNGSHGIGISSVPTEPPFRRPKIANNTSVCSYWGSNIRVTGGTGVIVENNLLRDAATESNMTVGVFGGDGANLDSAIIRGNLLVRGGASKFPYFPTESLIIGGDTAKVGFRTSNVDVVSNTITDSLFSGIRFDTSFNAVLQNNIISSPGNSGIVVVGDGPGVLLGNQIKSVPADQSPIAMTEGSRPVYPPISATSYNSASTGISYEACSEGGRDLAYIQNGSYVLYHTLDLTDVTTFVARVASDLPGGGIEIRLDNPNGMLIGTAKVTYTGGWQAWRTVTCPVTPTSGIHDVYLLFTGGAGNLFNLEWFSLYVEPQIMMATDYDTMSGGFKKETCFEKQTDLSFITENSYTSYSNIDLDGKKVFYARVAAPGPGGTIEIHLDAPTGSLLGTCMVPATGGWQNWKTVSCGLLDEKGTHNLFLVYKGADSGFYKNLEWFAFDLPRPASIEATRLNSASPGITFEACSEGGHDVTSFSNGAYAVYNDINLSGLGSFTARMASGTPVAGEVQVHLDSPTGPQIGVCQVPVTGNAQKWADQSCKLLPSDGFHNLYLVYNYIGNTSPQTFNLKSFRLSP
jgi:TolB-like protein